MTLANLARVQRRKAPSSVIQLNGFPHGLNTFVHPSNIAITEASEMVNWRIKPSGDLVTRYPVIKYTGEATTSSADVKTIGKVSIGGTQYTLAVDDNYVLYYINDSGTLGSEMLANEDMEDGFSEVVQQNLNPSSYVADNWSFTNLTGTFTASIEPSNVHDGTYAQRVETDGFETAAVVMTQDVTMVKGVTYAISVYVYTGNSSQVTLAVGGGTALDYTTTTDEWVQLSGDYTAEANGTHAINVSKYLSTSKYLIIDDFTCKPYATLTYETIGTTEGATRIVGYNDVALILDGSYIKYCDDVTEIKIAYDDGTGTSGYQFDWTGQDNDSSFHLGNGTNHRIAQKFTSQSWDSGYTIPPTTVSVYLSKEGTPGATAIAAKLRAVSNDDILASAELIADATELTGTATEYSVTFSSSEVTTEMSPSTDYYCSLEHSGGDLSNYVKVHYNNTGDATGLAYHYTTLWVANTGQNLLMSMRPGRPPKGAFGAVCGNRPCIAGDPDNPGYVWYGNLTHLDWSTSNGGGHVGAVDDSANNFEVGGLETLFGDLYIYGKQNQPYLSKTSGIDSPSTLSQSLLFQRPWTTDSTLLNASNDLWCASSDGVVSLSGVEAYGDLRTFTISDPVEDRISDYWSTSTAIAGYEPKDGQYWLVMPDYHRVLVSHTKNPSTRPEGGGIRYPWTEYEFYRDELTSSTYKWTESGNGTNEYYVELSGGGNPGITTQPDAITLDGTALTEGTLGSLNDHEWDYGDNDSLGYSTVYVRDNSGDPDSTSVVIRSILIPTALGLVGSDLMIGGSDGYIWTVDTSGSYYKDNDSIQILPILKTAYIEIPIGYGASDAFQLMAFSKGGGQMRVGFYVDGKRYTRQTYRDMVLSVHDGLTVGEAIMDIDDVTFDVDMHQERMFDNVDFNFHSVMLSFTDVTISGYPIYFRGGLFRYRGLGW